MNTGVWRVTEGWDPWTDMQRFQREVNRLFNAYTAPAAGYPPMNLWHDREQAVVQMEAPGLDPQKIRVSVEGQTLTVEGERGSALPEGDVAVHRKEREEGAFARALRLPFEAESEGVRAEYKAGVLTVRMPRKEATKPRAIQVAVG